MILVLVYVLIKVVIVCTAVALSIAAATTYVLLFGVYGTRVSGPLCALHCPCFLSRHWVICPCGCFEDARDSNLTRSSSTKTPAASVGCIGGTRGVRGFLNLCPCLLYTRLLRYTRLLNLARGGLSRSRARVGHCSLVRTAVWRTRGTQIGSYALLLMGPCCCLEDTRHSTLACSSSASFHTAWD